MKSYSVILIYPDEIAGDVFSACNEQQAVQAAVLLNEREDLVGVVAIPGEANLDATGFWQAKGGEVVGR